MRVYFIVLFVAVAACCYGQQNSKNGAARSGKTASVQKGADPYKGKPFKPGDSRTVRLDIPVGKITISNDITYKLLADGDGKIYRTDHNFRAYITGVKPRGKDSLAVPKSLTDSFAYRVIDLNEKQILSTHISTAKMDYFFAVDDFNLDGKPDFAFTGGRSYHRYPVKNYVWVNIDGKLAYWHNLSNVSSDKESKATRLISVIVTAKNGSYIPKYYYVVKDTFLVPAKLKL